MTYIVEVFNPSGRRLGYVGRGKLKLYPHCYSSPSAARLAEASYKKFNAHEYHHCFINKFVSIRHRFGICFPPR